MSQAGQPSPDQKRRSARSKVLLSATLEWPGRILSVTLRNLSELGAMIETAEDVPLGSDLIFRRKDLHIEGHVAWVHGRLAGIAFSQPLNAELLLQHVPPAPVRRPAPESVCRRPGFGRAQMSAEEQRWVETMRRSGS